MGCPICRRPGGLIKIICMVSGAVFPDNAVHNIPVMAPRYLPVALIPGDFSSRIEKGEV